MNEREIQEYYKMLHDDLTERYYSDPEGFPGGKEAFDREHADNWVAMEARLVAEGYSQLPGLSIEQRVKALEEKIGKE